MLYRVVNYNGKECVYEGQDEDLACRMARQYSSACGDYYVEQSLEEEITVPVKEIDFDSYDDEQEAISDYLSDLNGYCVLGFNYEIKGKKCYITKIEWDTTID